METAGPGRQRFRSAEVAAQRRELVERLLPIRSQFIVSGNIRDSVLATVGGATLPVPFLRGLWEKLKAQGYQYVLVFDPADGVRVYPNEPATVELATKIHELKL